MSEPLKTLRRDALAIFHAGLAAVEPRAAVLAHMRLEGEELAAGGYRFPLPRGGRLLVVGAGKGVGPMAAAVEELLGERIAGGVVVTRYGHTHPLRRIRLREAGHPLPDRQGMAAAEEVIDLLQGAGEKDLVICLISGGGSALLPAPPEKIPLTDKLETTRLLLNCGAEIREVNTVRKHLSRLKGGGLARQAAPARVVTLILSDVVGDPLEVIASGPTVPDPSTFADALAVLARYRLEEKIPRKVRIYLEQGAAGEIPETPKPDDPAFAGTVNLLVGSNAQAVRAAAEKSRRLGYRTLVLTTTVTGEARHAAAVFGAMAREMAVSGNPIPPPACLIAGGETTVTVRAEGHGGRNQEFVLAGALKIAGLDDVLLLSAGTDGTDGPTDAAGALADGTTLDRARQAGLDPRRHLENNDAYPFFQALDDLVLTGPTGTNVMDLMLVLAAERRPPS